MCMLRHACHAISRIPLDPPSRHHSFEGRGAIKETPVSRVDPPFGLARTTTERAYRGGGVGSWKWKEDKEREEEKKRKKKRKRKTWKRKNEEKKRTLQLITKKRVQYTLARYRAVMGV
mgnify:CR=1 FL=1